MDGNISKALWLGVSILLFIAVVTIGLTVFGNMKNATNAANDKINSITESVSNEDFSGFDGKEAKGEQILSAINSFSGRSGEVIVLVATLGSNGGTPVTLDPKSATSIQISRFTQYVSGITGGSLTIKDYCYILSGGSGELLTSKSKTLQDAEKRDAENANLPSKYINPAGKFQAYLIYDANQKIKGIICAQVE